MSPINRFQLDLNNDLDSKTLKEFQSHLQSIYSDESIKLDFKTNYISVSTSNTDTKIKCLEQKTIKFNQYQFKASETGYKSNHFYEQNHKMLIIKNIENDDLIVRMYAEYLQPDNDIIQVTSSRLVDNTFYIQYNNELDTLKLAARLSKKPMLANRKIELQHSFNTNSIIIWSNKSKIEQFALTDSFYELYSNKYILIQANDKLVLDDYNHEPVYNFDLVSNIFIRKLESTTEKLKQNRKPSETKPILNNLLYFKAINTQQLNKLENIIKMELNNLFYLNEQEPMVVGVLNSSQLLVDLNQILNQINYECIIEKLPEQRILIRLKSTIQSESQYETRLNLINDCLKEFCDTKFVYQQYELTEQLLKSSQEFQLKFKEHCNEVNRRFTAVYLNYENGTLYTYGSVNSLNKVMKNLEKFLIESKPSDEVHTKQQVKVIFSSQVSQILKSDLPSDNSNQISLKMYPILRKCLLNCQKIVSDLKNDLKAIECDLIDTNNGLIVNSKIENNLNNIKKVLNSYEANKLKEEFIKVDDNFRVESNIEILIKSVQNENGLNDLKQIMTTFYQSDKVVYCQLNNDSEFQIYGYLKAVNGFADYLKKKVEKATDKVLVQDQKKLEFNVKISTDLSTALFSKFDGMYLDDLIKQLAKLKAFAVNLGNDNTMFQIGCLDNKLTANNKKSINMSGKYNDWRENVDSFLKLYLERMQFGSDVIEMPFGRTDPEAVLFLYDKNSLDIKWLTDKNIEVFGLNTEIVNLKERIIK